VPRSVWRWSFSVGGNSEAQIARPELNDDDDIEVSIGNRIQAVVVSTSGGIMQDRWSSTPTPPT
jgi:hypothetical protein